LKLVTGMLIHFEDDDPMDLSGNFYGIGNLLSFDYKVFRRRGRISLQKEATALLEGAFGCPGEMPDIETWIGVDSSRRERSPVRISKKE
jgi:hypothetical protein